MLISLPSPAQSLHVGSVQQIFRVGWQPWAQIVHVKSKTEVDS